VPGLRGQVEELGGRVSALSAQVSELTGQLGATSSERDTASAALATTQAEARGLQDSLEMKGECGMARGRWCGARRGRMGRGCLGVCVGFVCVRAGEG
jgi:hypothetical protein